MTSIDDIIKREVNPFDPTTFKQGHFWLDKQDAALTVDSIHAEAIAEIESVLDLVIKDHSSRTVMLAGDPGSGKSYLLGRIKRTLNPKAFFAYISPWRDSDGIWRHILRYTVESLMCKPEGQAESQLMLWLKSLSAFTKRSLKQRIFDDSVWSLLQSDRQKFIKHLKDTYKQAGIYNADNFFGVLHDLTNPELYPLACEWLQGQDLSDESLQSLKLKRSIQTEADACAILSNFGRISTSTQPIVLCFDQLEAIARLPDGSLDLQALFSVNSQIQNEKWKNFLIIISITTGTWKQNVDRIHQSDKAGIYKGIGLKRINLDQAEALWEFRIYPLHSQANPKPDTKIYPLTRQALEDKFPGGKTDPRNTLGLGRQLFQEYKEKIVEPIIIIDPETELLAALKLLWQDEYKKVQSSITKIDLYPSQLIGMLVEVLTALQVKEIKTKLLTGHFASYSLSYQNPHQRGRVGIVWTEDMNMKSFFNAMNACQKAIDNNLCQNIQLIRAASVGDKKLAGNKIYRQIFTGSPHRHIQPNLESVHYFAAYQNLVNASLANELVVAGKTINRQELDSLIRKTDILKGCNLLQELGIAEFSKIKAPDMLSVKELLLNLIVTQGMMGLPKFIKEGCEFGYGQVDEPLAEKLVHQLCVERKIRIVNPKEKREEQLVCWIP
ncbi:MAG TPA: KAP family P-loop domain-containing protein [Cyanobacteria bacterium UBA11372]|nr:KAP family P-loop domain-containing protein [Cyanobacteria bacterium UBA11372]